MNIIRSILGWGHDRLAILHCPVIKSLPRWMRLLHPKSRKHLIGSALGLGLMLTGSAMATNAAAILAVVHVPHCILDGLAYFLHGVGAIPFMGHIEPLWKLLSD